MPDPTFRFAAGSTEKPRSNVWRLWVHGSDIYLAVRMLAGTMNFSMHQSGNWISAFTEQSGVILETGTRRHTQWQRPPEFRLGWTQGPTIMVPWVPWRDQLPWRFEESPADTEWVPEPKRNKKLLFNIVISAPGVIETASVVSRPGDRLLDRNLPLANGEAVWLQVRQAEMLPPDHTYIESASKNLNVHHTGDAKSFAAFMTVIGESDQHTPMFVQIPLGRRHLRSEG